MRAGLEGRTSSRALPCGPSPLGPVSPTASRHRHAGLAFFLLPAAAARNFHFYVLLPKAGAVVLDDGVHEFLLALQRFSDACAAAGCRPSRTLLK
jgi:hypothetical protein